MTTPSAPTASTPSPAAQPPHSAAPRGRRSRRRVALLVVAAGAAVALGGAWMTMGGARTAAAASAGGTAPSGTRMTSDLVVVETGDFDVTTTATGELRARNQVEVRNPLESETSITEIIPEGTTVKAGDVLIRLNTESIQTRVEEESLQLESARAALVEAEESYQIQVSENESSRRAADLKLALAELDLAQWKSGEVESKKLELNHALERASKDEGRLKDKLAKSRALFAKGYYSEDSLKQDELAWEQAANALAKAELDKQVYLSFQYPKDERKKKSDVDEAKAELERVQRQNASRLASKEADRNNKRQALTIRETKFNKYRDQLAAAVIKAPRDGLVVYSTSMEGGFRWGGDDGPLQIGKKVSPNELLIVLPDTTEMIASVKVHESLAGRIRPGQAATIKVDAEGERRFNGRVDSIGILAEQTSRWMDPNLREYTVKIALDMGQVLAMAPAAKDAPAKVGGTAHALKPSMRAEAEIMLGRVSGVMTVPVQAVFSDGLVRYVHVEDGGKFLRRPVQVGQRSDRFAEVRVGVQPGQRVLIRKPDPSEVIARPWEAKELAAVGLMMNDQGVVVPVGMPGGPGKPGALAGKGPGGSTTPGASAPPKPAAVAAADAPKTDGADSKPASGGEEKKDDGAAAEKPAAGPVTPAASQPPKGVPTTAQPARS